ncbi:MAG TPA: hypothetical protein DEZ08_02515 [Dehalococcoidia bacterium]|jgi:NADH-quinone oxidoreductase subunit J|nr:hypothetical protein [Dehalococcoidia bacterium]|tara:strand:- start:12 stop:506 length:495 start_codon:yes stop_codon:yes gene_type:complete
MMHFIVFILISIVLLGCSLGVVLSKNIIHAALSLLIALLSVSGIYLVLLTEFLAVVQLLIYGGAIVIVILFALMLTRNDDYPRISNHKLWPIAGVIAISVMVTLSAAYYKTYPIQPDMIQEATVQELGTSLFTTWAIPFELASLVLLVALIGAIVIARSDKGDN